MHANLKRLGSVWLVSLVSVGMAAGPDLRLVAAARERNTQAVRALLTEGVDVNTARADGATALIWAAHWDEIDVVDLLLRAGADVNAAEGQGVTPLALACENASAAMVAKLLSAGANPNAAQTNGLSPLTIAARTGNLDIVKALLAHGARVNAAIPSTGQTALMWAAAEGHRDVMQELIKAGADVRAPSTIGFTPLLFATRNGDIEAAKILIAAGADVNEPGSDGTHSLPLAVVSGHDAFARFLLELGADVNSTMYGVTALHAAVSSVDQWLRDWLRERGASVNTRSTSGLAPDRRLAMMKALLAQGADPNARIATSKTQSASILAPKGAFDFNQVGTGDMKGATALWIAADVANTASRAGDPSDASGALSSQIIRLLLDAGADPSIPTADLTTPLMAASGLGHGSYFPGQKRGVRSPSAEAAVKLLIEAGADVNAVNEGSFTALHGAAFRGLNEVIQILVDHGANINAQDFQGRTAYRIAEGTQQVFREQPWPETAAFLRSLGADTALGPVAGRTQERELERRRAAETGKP